jgi:hypothetical protein
MTLIAPQERPTAHRPAPEGEAALSARELKYRHDAAHYVADMLTELRQIAGKAGFDKLVTSIDTAYYDAYAELRSNAKPAPADATEKVSSGTEQSPG